jgi:tetratricopeptide (TPR) repeat protein
MNSTAPIVEPLPWQECRHIRTAIGWLGLGDWQSASDELANIRPAFQAHVRVLDLRIRVHLRSDRPDLALLLTETLLSALPDDATGLNHRSLALQKLGRVQEALDLLLPLADRFPTDCMIPYNLACYLCQLGRLDEARQMLARSLAIKGSMRRQLCALSDPDLAPLWSKHGCQLPTWLGQSRSQRQFDWADVQRFFWKGSLFTARLD